MGKKQAKTAANPLKNKKLFIIIGGAVLTAIAVTVILIIALSPKNNISINSATQIRDNVKIGGAKITASDSVDGVKTINAEISTDCNLAREESGLMYCDDIKFAGEFISSKEITVTASNNARDFNMGDEKVSFTGVEIQVSPIPVTETAKKDKEVTKYVLTMEDNESGDVILVYNLTVNTVFSDADNKLINDNAKPVEFSGNGGGWVSPVLHMDAGTYVVKYSLKTTRHEYGWGVSVEIGFNKNSGEWSPNTTYLSGKHDSIISGEEMITISSADAGDYRIGVKVQHPSDASIGDWTLSITK